MPDKKTIELAKQDEQEGKSPSTQAGEFVKAEMDKIRSGAHGVKNAKQAIAIGLSEARRAGVKLPAKGRAKAKPATKAKGKPNPKRSAAAKKALKKMPGTGASPTALSRQAKSAAKKRGPAARSAAAKKGARTRKENHTEANQVGRAA